MQNIFNLTGFIRALRDKPLGFSALYLVPEDKGYSKTVNSLIATAGREGVKISTSQMLITDPAALTTVNAVNVTRK